MARISRETKQKDTIRKEVASFKSFFTAHELHEKARKRDSQIGIATIYRFLNELSKKEELHCYMCGKHRVYSTEKESHCHFICRSCGQKTHIEIESIDFIKKKIKGDICHFQVDVFGVCEQCSKSP